MRVCYFGTYRKNYPRNRLNINRLVNQGVDVIECHSKLWKGDLDRHNLVAGGWKKADFWLRTLKAYINLIIQYFRINHYDVMVVGYPGQFDIVLARLLTWIKCKPLVWDVLMSLYLIAVERNLQDRNKFIVSVIHNIEKIVLRLPDILIVDTENYAEWYHEHYRINKEKIRILPLGTDDRIFFPTIENNRAKVKCFIILYYGSFIPNHDVLVISETAKQLKEFEDIKFIMIGDGPDKSKVLEHVNIYDLNNVILFDWLDQKDLVEWVSIADVILGTFGNTPQSLMTIQNKIWESLAMAKPIITGNSDAIKSCMIHGEHLYLCERGNPESLAKAIIALKHDSNLRNKISTCGYGLFKNHYSIEKTAILLKSYIDELVSSK